jgi:hypothetical protein
MKKLLIALICLGVVVAYAAQPRTDYVERQMPDHQTLKQMDLERNAPPTYKVTGDYPHGEGRAILLSEDFESGMPATWKIVDGNGGYTTWRVGYTTDLLGYNPPNYGTAYAFYSDDDASSGAPAGNEYLISPAVYTGGAPSTFHYSYGYNDISTYYDSFTVQVQYHSGAAWGAWNTLVIYNSDVIGVDTFTLAAAESVMVRFVYMEGPFSTWSWASACDNVFIESPADHDVGCTEIVGLADGPISPGAYDIKGRIKNLGLNAETFDAIAEVWDTDASTMLWTNSATFTSFPVGGNTVHNFGSYTFGDNMNFEVKIYTTLAGDEDPSNDASSVFPRTALGLGDVVFEMDAETPTGDIRLLGVEFDGTYFYATGAYNFTIAYVHVLDIAGNLVFSVPQPFWCWGSWGWRDIADDGTTWYASVFPYVDEWWIDIGTATLNVTGAFPGPHNPCRALAYSGDGPWWYTGNFSSYVYKWKKDWSAMWYNTNPNGWAMYGAAYDTDFDEGGWIWWHSQDDPGTGHYLQLSQMDASTFLFTGLTVGYVPTMQTSSGVAGGACFYEGFMGWDVIFTMIQGTPDEICGVFVRNHVPAVEATINWEPNTLNLGSTGNWVKCWIGLEEGWSVYDIDPYSVNIYEVDGVGITPVYCDGSVEYDGDLALFQFDRQEVQDAIAPIVIPPAYAELAVCGDVDDAGFVGMGVLRVIHPQYKDGAMGAELPVAFALYETTPNPFSAHTVIRYALPTQANVKLNIYDVTGRKVKTLVNGTVGAGYHNVNWDARDDWGRRVSSGTYFVKFDAEDHTDTRKLTLLK